MWSVEGFFLSRCRTSLSAGGVPLLERRPTCSGGGTSSTRPVCFTAHVHTAGGTSRETGRNGRWSGRHQREARGADDPTRQKGAFAGEDSASLPTAAPPFRSRWRLARWRRPPRGRRRLLPGEVHFQELANDGAARPRSFSFSFFSPFYITAYFF